MSYALSAIIYGNQKAIAMASSDLSTQDRINAETYAHLNDFLGVNAYQMPQQQNNFVSSMWCLDNALNQNYNFPGFSNLNNIVAANETGTITGDPHFRGGDGDTYDVQGVPGKTYNLLNDTNLSYNGTFTAWGNRGATVVGQSAINVANITKSEFSSITFDKTGVAKINGQELKDGQTVILADGGTACKQGNCLTVKTAEGYTIKQTAMPGGYINSEVKTSALGVATDNVLPGGLLGQTFDPDKIAKHGAKGAGAQGEGAINGKVQDYETCLNKIGDVKLDKNGKEIKETDWISEMILKLSQMLNPQPNKSYLSILDFVMTKVFQLLAKMGE